MNKNKKIELMAPVGNIPILVAACKAGADAVYFGVNDFTMRAGKRNFKISDLPKIKKICDSYPRKPKMYLVMNTIIYDQELKKLESTIKKVKGKVDAIICWDLAVIEFCKKHKVPFFISTQASIANTLSAKFYKKLGAKRVVLARELNLKQVKEIMKIKGLEVEVFIHGAMCVSVSGRCFTSQFLYNKSANRGECFQPCRRSYFIKEEGLGHELTLEGSKVMSAKDLCVLPFVEELKKIGVHSFKIEGRNRDSRYVDAVVRVYREAIDTKLTKERTIELMKELEGVYNRGFSSGFFLGKPLPSDFSQVDSSASEIEKVFVGKVIKFYPKVGAITIKLVSELQEGDRIIIIGDDIGIKEVVASEMEINNKKVVKGIKSQEIGIKMPFKVARGAEVYKLKKRSS